MNLPEIHTFTVESTGDGPTSVASGWPDPNIAIHTIAPDDPEAVTDEELQAFGFTRPDAADGQDDIADVWYGPDGEEHDGHTASIFMPGTDPVPHYNRGRTRIEPQSPHA